ncbi:MAG: hypothetical protein KDA93_21185 [Planctomycetaceae bacterium]|nr:hypothetical protein [Planctomycetaceae bacterium]
MTDSSGSFEVMLITLAVFVPSLIGVGASLLLPQSLKDFARRNAVRFDGSHSPDRLSRERRARRRYLLSVTTVPLLTLLPLAIGVALMHQWVVPVDMAVAAMERFDPDAEQWEENLKDPSKGDIGKAHEAWAKKSGLASDVADTWQHSLWKAWPAVIAVGLVLLAVCLALTAQTYVRAFRQYRDGIVARSREYHDIDLQRMAHESGAADVA